MFVNLSASLTAIFAIVIATSNASQTQYSDKKRDLNVYKERVIGMFYHAYNSYIEHAYPYDELKPITCSGFDTWGSYSLTLIDSLDMLLILGNYTEFKRVIKLLETNLDYDKDINVSVFETNIRVIGGLLSAHLLSYKRFESSANDNGEILVDEIDENWPCDGPLLRMALRFANKLLPAFATNTGMPYGTVNLNKGVPKGETQETCTAGVGTFLVEFATLSRLSGDPIYEEVAMKAMRALWDNRSKLNLVGNHINIDSGKWTAHDATIGSGVDSYFEYLVKAGILLDKHELLQQFDVYKHAINKHLMHGDWYLWANMNSGHKTMPLFSSLDAYYPGLLTLVGDLEQAKRTLNEYHRVLRQYGSLPEMYNVKSGDVHSGREGYPLRPELIESIMYMYRATGEEIYITMAIDFIEAIERIAKLDCGFATVKDVRDHKLENRMESFFIAETLKYLYLIFDEDNFLHKDTNPKIIRNSKGVCLVETGFYVFNTEAHPIEGAALDCCQRLNGRNHKETSLDLNKLLNKVLELNSGIRRSDKRAPLHGINERPLDIDECRNVSENKNEETSYKPGCSIEDKFRLDLTSIHDKTFYV